MESSRYYLDPPQPPILRQILNPLVLALSPADRRPQGSCTCQLHLPPLLCHPTPTFCFCLKNPMMSLSTNPRVIFRSMSERSQQGLGAPCFLECFPPAACMSLPTGPHWPPALLSCCFCLQLTAGGCLPHSPPPTGPVGDVLSCRRLCYSWRAGQVAWTEIQPRFSYCAQQVRNQIPTTGLYLDRPSSFQTQHAQD